MTRRARVALAWSGGKDSAMAHLALRDDPGVELRALLTTVAEPTGAVSHHGIPSELLHAQADAMGLPLVTVPVPDPCSDVEYAARLRGALATPPLDEVDEFAFGDLFLEDVRSYREARLAEAGRRARFPLWGKDTATLARETVAAGVHAVVCAVDTTALDASWLGWPYDAALLEALPPTVDPCGERGEMHTFVWDSPGFAAAIPWRAGAAQVDGRFAHLMLEGTHRR